MSHYLLTETERDTSQSSPDVLSFNSTNTSHKNSLTKFCSLCSLYLIGVIKVLWQIFCDAASDSAAIIIFFEKQH